MKTREEAIKWMEEAIQDTNTHWNSCSEALQKELNEQREAFLLAIDAILHADRKQKLEAENMELKERIIHWQKYMAPTREQVEKSWAGCEYCEKHKINLVRIEMNYNDSLGSPKRLNPTRVPKFCPICGRPLTDEAVQMVMEKLEALYENIHND